ncbi:competence protein ComFC [Aliicoccus persicus]|uniref:Competence protein ComFC n=1 Tax=Aliicoccus persicus TaxID=930138 RepID=A0A662Z311_9STAP|nr:competence protein ComFC [Aliicoccus persicus]
MICLYCHSPLSQHVDIFSLFQKSSIICHTCEKKLSPLSDSPTCKRCANKTEEAVDLCESCLFLSQSFKHLPNQIITVFDYNKEVQQLFHRYKFVNDAAMSEVIAHFINVDFKKYDLVIPIPISNKRLEERTYNQVSLVLDQLNVNYSDILKTNKVKRQSELTKAERLREKQIFFMHEGDKERVYGANILLVDDIYTTGITVHQAIQELYAHNCKNIDLLTFSRS